MTQDEETSRKAAWCFLKTRGRCETAVFDWYHAVTATHPAGTFGPPSWTNHDPETVNAKPIRARESVRNSYDGRRNGLSRCFVLALLSVRRERLEGACSVGSK